MAGGKGTRIASVKSDVPKPMIEICGKPVLEYQIENLRECGLTDIILVIGHMGWKIKEYFGDGRRFGVQISYFEEELPLGTAGALYQIPGLDDDFLLLCGDVMLSVDFNRFIAFHRQHHAWASLMAHPNGHPYDSALLETEVLPPNVPGGLPVETSRVTRWINKEDSRTYYKNRVNAGIEIISPLLLREAKKILVPRHPEQPDRIDLDRDILKPMVMRGHIYAYDTPEYIKDMGTPDRYAEVTADVQSGKVHARNLSCLQRAIFLDRDGTINREKGFLNKVEDMELIQGATDAIRMINRSEYLAVIITNQPVIARGECSFEELQHIHERMETELGREGAYIDGLYVCPHHTDRGFDGERSDYKYECDCRKPKPGLLLQAAKDLNIDLSQSYVIGDSDRDTEAGRNAGCRECIKIEKNKDYALAAAVKNILNQ